MSTDFSGALTLKEAVSGLDMSFIMPFSGSKYVSPSESVFIPNGYRVRMLSSENLNASWHYNPFDYAFDESGAVVLSKVEAIVSSLTDALVETEHITDSNVKGNALCLLEACAFYLMEFNSDDNARNMYHLSRLIKKAAIESENCGTELNKLFEDAKTKKPSAECLGYFEKFMALSKGDQSFAVNTVISALCAFEIPEIAEITTTSERDKISAAPQLAYTCSNHSDFDWWGGNLNLYSLGDQKTAVFVDIPQKDADFLYPMLCRHAQKILFERILTVCRDRWMITTESGTPLISMFLTDDQARNLLEKYNRADSRDAFRKKGSGKK